MPLLNNYSGSFDPDLKLHHFSRRFLSGLMHEFNLIGHLLDRVGQPLVAMEYGEKGFVKSAIEEWQCASPIYSKRMQRLMKFEGEDVGTVFKNIQLEIGSPQQFLDFQFRLDSPDYGEFWLSFCGALHDLEINGNDTNLIKSMCHDIEDPTFDATAAATNPRMIMRPVHRPPRNEGGNGCGRYPVCRWKVSISDESQTFVNHPNLAIVGRSKIASIEIEHPTDIVEPGGWDDYSGSFDPHCQFEDFSQKALTLLIQENAVQALLLANSYILSQVTNHGIDVGKRLAERVWVGHAAIAVVRLKRFLDLPGDDIETLAKIMQLHPHFYPRTYVDAQFRVLEPNRLRVSINECPALTETIPYSWFTQLGDAPPPALEALAQQVNPRARCYPVDDKDGAKHAWDIVIDLNAQPAKEPLEVRLGRFSSGVNFKFEQRRLPGLIARA